MTTTHIHIFRKFTVFPIMPWFLVSCFLLIPGSSPAQIPGGDFQLYQPLQFNQNSQNLNRQNFQRYLVYVDSSDSQVLQRVRLIEPDAYIRQYQGRYIIQSGIFGQMINATNRVRELQSYGISNARIVNFTDNREISTGFVTPRQEPLTGFPPKRQESGYYAIIPVKSQDLRLIANNIRVGIGYNNLVLERQKPRGTHVAVGPFTSRSEAEQWNKYLRELGYGNARVYYGQ